MSWNSGRALALGSVLALLMTACGGGGGGEAAAYDSSAGSLDTAFGTSGKVITDMGGTWDEASRMAIQADGKIVVVGRGYNGSGDDFGVARYNTDGTLDSSFGASGKVLTDFLANNTDFAYGIAIQPNDQRIVVVGGVYNQSTTRTSFGIARYNTNGSLDSGFSLDGRVMTDMSPGEISAAHGVAIQADGKIVVVGSAGSSPRMFAVARYTTYGTLDTDFNGTGMCLTDADSAAGHQSDAYDVAIQEADQKIVVVGSAQNSGHQQMALVRYEPDGSLDTTFNATGITVCQVENASEAHAVAIQADGKILAAGYCNMLAPPNSNQFALVRYTSAGSLDPTFSTDGIVATAIGVTDDKAQDLALQTDGRIVVVGYSNNGSHHDFALARYASDGTLDTAFGTGGKTTAAVGSEGSRACGVGIQSDHKIVVAGTTLGADPDFSLIRVWP